MKLMNKLSAILFAATLLTACGGKDKKVEDKTPQGKLEGAWEIKRAEGIMGPQNVGAIYEFKGNKMTYRKVGFTITGTALITDSTFTLQSDGNERVELYTYRFNGDTLVVVTPKNVGPVLYMIKK